MKLLLCSIRRWKKVQISREDSNKYSFNSLFSCLKWWANQETLKANNLFNVLAEQQESLLLKPLIFKVLHRISYLTETKVEPTSRQYSRLSHNFWQTQEKQALNQLNLQPLSPNTLTLYLQFRLHRDNWKILSIFKLWIKKLS